jgi:hypothetical protein
MVKIRCVSYMACQNEPARTLNWPRAWPMRRSGAVWCRSGDPAPAGAPLGGVKPPLLHHYPLRAEIDKGGLKVEPAWEGKLAENTGLSLYFLRGIERRALLYRNSQDGGDSQNVIESKVRELVRGDILKCWRSGKLNFRCYTTSYGPAMNSRRDEISPNDPARHFYVPLPKGTPTSIVRRAAYSSTSRKSDPATPRGSFLPSRQLD